MVTDPSVAEPAASEDITTSAPRTRGWRYDALAVAVLLALFPVVHDVGSYLRAPYWLDEAWVALSTRFPLADLPSVTASTPLGFSFLLRLLPSGELRVLPLIFHLVCLVAAYTLGRQLASGHPGVGRLAGLGCAATVLLLPVAQVRHDLKQYTADAAVTLILLGLVAWTEADWSRRHLAVIAAVAGAATLVSSVAAISAACAFGGLVLGAATRRHWRRLVEVTVAGVVAGALILAILLGTAERGRTDNLREYWAPYFPSIGDLPGFLWHHANELSPMVGMASPVLAAFFLLGVLTAISWGHPGTAAAMALLPVAAIVLGLARIYPLLDLRTSHFLLVATGAVAGLGVVGTATWLVDRFAAQDARPRGQVVAAALATMVVLVGFAGVNHRWYRFDGAEPGVGYQTPQTLEDTRTAAAYVSAHRGPGDVIVLSQLSRYGFAFYWSQGPVELVKPYPTAISWMAGVADPGIVAIDGRTTADIRPRLEAGLDLARQRGPQAKVWLVRSHLTPQERYAWQQVLADYHLDQVTGGVDPIYLISR